MRVTLFVGNLPWSFGDAELADLFQSHGVVHSARVITDRETGRSRGFGFVELETHAIDSVLRAMHEHEVDGRLLRVSEAEDKSGFGGPRRSDRGPRTRY